MFKLLPACMAILLLLAACQPKENPEAIKSVTRSLEQANAALLDNNQFLCQALDEKTKDPQTHIRALIWQPKARAIRSFTAALTQYIDTLKNQSLPFDKVVNQLYNKIIAYTGNIITTLDTMGFSDNSFIQQQVKEAVQQFKQEIPARLGTIESVTATQVDAVTWTKQYAHAPTPLLALAVLNRLQNDILVVENKLLSWCNDHTIVLTHEYISYQPLAVLNHSYVKSGEPIEVTAGIGAFSFAVEKITINGKEVPLGSNGLATYRFTATEKPGRYTMPLTIDYTLHDGTRSKVNKQLTYTVEK